MAGYGYGGYKSDYSTGGQAVGSYTDQWGRPRYASTDDDCRSVIVNADGTQRTVLGCTPFSEPGAYVTKTETIIEERVHSPSLPSYRHSSHPEVVAPVTGYGYTTDDSWQRRPSSPIRGGYGYADQASIIAPSNGANWRQQPHQTGHYNGTGYTDYNDYSNPKYLHNGKSNKYDGDNYYRKNESGRLGPGVSHAKPSRSGYSTGSVLPVRGDGRLTLPTDDMERALHYLKESAKTSPWSRT